MLQSDQKYPHLHTLIGGWFHEDYRIDGDTLEQVLSSYKKAYPLEDRLRVRAEIMTFLQERDDAQVRADFVRLFYPGVEPEAWGMTTRQWLLRIAQLLE